MLVQIFFKGLQVVLLDEVLTLLQGVGYYGVGVDLSIRRCACALTFHGLHGGSLLPSRAHHSVEVKALPLQLDRVVAQHVALHGFNICVYTIGQR